MSVGVRTCLLSHKMDPQPASPRQGGDSLHGRELKVFKILILGDSGTGKTALVRRSVHDFFTEGYRSTIGVDFSLKVGVVQLILACHRHFHEYCKNYRELSLTPVLKVLRWTEDLEIRLQMWDLAGQDRFNHLSRLYFNKAAGALLVCDQSCEKSLEGIIKWKKELDSKLLDTPAVILVNKDDLREEAGVSDDDIVMEELARDLGIVSWTRTSAKTGTGVEEGIR